MSAAMWQFLAREMTANPKSVTPASTLREAFSAHDVHISSVEKYRMQVALYRNQWIFRKKAA